MDHKSKGKFTLKIISSYVVLGVLALLAAGFIYSEFKNYAASQNKEDDSLKLVKTNVLLTNLYEAENLSKLALQTKKPGDLKAYAQKVDSIDALIDSLKPLIDNVTGTQVAKLDSVQKLLQQKVYNSAELRKLKVENENSASIDSILQAFHKMEVDMGRITPETFVPNFDVLSPEKQKFIREYVAILNKNIPDHNGTTNAKNIDSILQVSKSILNKAKVENAAIERSMFQKELQIYRTDLELSQKMRSIISTFERDIVQKAFRDNLNQQQILRRSTRLAGGAIILGLLIVILFTFLISQDFWKIQRYRDQLEQEKKNSESILKSREQLITTVSHDLRTPLNTISGYSDLMEHSGLNEKQQKYLKNVKSASGYVENLVNDLLDFSKLEAGKIHLERIPFVLSNLIEETALHFKEVHSKKEVELQLEIAEELERPIISDPFRIRQILTNIIGNAFKFTHEGFIKILASVEENKQGPWVTIKVEDTGIGIEKKKQEFIFKEFTQAENNTTEKKYGGYGLGLTISKKLTALLHGNLTLESEKNVGSTFTISLPLEFSSKTIKKQDTKKPSFQNRLSLLILDDDENMLGLLEEICHVNQIEVQSFSHYSKLIEMSPKGYDAILTDIQMPEIDGFGVLEKLKQNNVPNYKGQPVIAMTGQKVKDKTPYIEAGFMGVLQKPFSSESLLDILSKIYGYMVSNTNANPLQETIPKPNTNLFNTEGIAAFLESNHAVREVLEVFMENTLKNMELLTLAVEQNDADELRSISHKMLPMFRQLEIHEIIPILQRLEQLNGDAQSKSVFSDLGQLKKVISKLENAIMEYLAILPARIG
ncbi:hybrid sensor histidine kinase/response regulator [Muricauda sp. MAR_2010_75]|uniref:hybrid sensor histidine kinase/response regulator n=1 Tax=Allomuricauda sp. MAR_2010_75 TaxID=1250232 RepID=UPI00068D6943|nr:ATP-binding protein [Muricauda sp. MAR_2010_75]